MFHENTNAPPRRILVVDDDAELRAHIRDYLTTHGFILAEAADSLEMDAALARDPVDLIILDVMLPREDGLAICRRLSGHDAPPILMLSAMGAEVDRVLGLELGADGYLAKPCSARELLAHVRAILRRREDTPQHGAVSRNWSFNGFTVDLVRRQLKAPNDAVVVLTHAEFALLTVFLHSPRTVISRESLAEAAGSEDPAFVRRSVDVLVSRMRRKFEEHGQGELIRTYRGQGYLFDAIVHR